VTIASSIRIPEDAWTDVEGDRSLLLTTLVVDGCSLHLEAIAVEMQDATQAWPVRHDELRPVRAATGAGGPWETVTIGGRAYVLHGTPFCA